MEWKQESRPLEPGGRGGGVGKGTPHPPPPTPPPPSKLFGSLELRLQRPQPAAPPPPPGVLGYYGPYSRLHEGLRVGATFAASIKQWPLRVPLSTAFKKPLMCMYSLEGPRWDGQPPPPPFSQLLWRRPPSSRPPFLDSQGIQCNMSLCRTWSFATVLLGHNGHGVDGVVLKACAVMGSNGQ